MLVKTVKRTVSRDASNNEVFIPIEIIATIPNNIDSENSKRIPISLTFRNVNDSQEIAKLQCYHYAIPRYNSKDIVDIPLVSSVDDWISEVSRKIAVSIARKYGKPCYVAWSSSQSIESASFPMDQLFILKKCKDLLGSIIA